MGIAPCDEKIIGYFTEVEFGKVFEYTNIDPNDIVFHTLAHGGKVVQFPHKIFVGPLFETRYACVKKTVAHVVVDERELNGRSMFVIEKWRIKNHRILVNK